MNRFVVGLVVLLMIPNISRTQNRVVTAADLAKALKECESDLDIARFQIGSLRTALDETNKLIDKRRVIADSLIKNLTQQLAIQDSAMTLFRTNSDSLELMIHDYSTKLDEINKLYLKELSRQKQPWYLSRAGLKGLFNGFLVGGAVGLSYSLLKK